MEHSGNILRKIGIFAELPEESLKKINSLIQERTYKAGSIIFYEGDPGEIAYFIRSGKVKVFKLSEAGGEKILRIFKAGDIIGEVVLFSGGEYPASAQALEEARVGSISNRDLENLILQDPAIAVQIIKTMAARLRRAQQQVASITQGDVQARVVQTILVLANEHGQATPRGIEIGLSLSHQEIANMVGTSRETVSRVLNRLKKEQVIEVEKQKIIVPHLEKLLEWTI